MFMKVLILVSKTSASIECTIFHNWYFLDKTFKGQSDVCIECHDVLMMSINLNDNATLSIRDLDYCCIISGISQNENVNLLQNTDLSEQGGTLFSLYCV